MPKLGWNGTAIAWLEDFEKASEILRSYDLAEMCQSLELKDELLDRLLKDCLWQPQRRFLAKPGWAVAYGELSELCRGPVYLRSSY